MEPEELDPDRRFRRWLLAITVLGLILRIAYVLLEKRDQPPGGDAYYYHYQARIVADGHGFVNPLLFNARDVSMQAADHPPLYILFLAFFSKLGLRSFLTHKLLSTGLGALSIWVSGLMGREVVGRRVGLLCAGIAALYPNFWLHDGMVMSETSTILTVAATLWLGWRFWHRPTFANGAWFGVAGGLGALAHPDTVLLLPLIGIPLTIGVRRLGWGRVVAHLAVMAVASLVVMSPWLVYNLSRFEKPVLLSHGLGITLAVSNCDETYDGYFRAFWHMPCVLPPRHDPPPGDPSEQETYWRDVALDYIREHRSEQPAIIAARVGRAWQLYRPIQQNYLDLIEGHEMWVSRAAMAWYYPLLALAVAGTVVAKRRGIPISPIVAPAIVVTIAAGMTFGNTRYRASAEPAIVVAAAIAVDAAVSRRRRSGDAPHEEERALATVG